MAMPSFQNLVLNSNTGGVLKTYTPGPHDGKFAIDLLFALQHHLPLTWFQNVFLFTVLCPGPFAWKLSFFNWLYALPPANVYLIPIGLIAIAIVAIYLIRKYSWRVIFKKEPLTFLELTFPHTTGKSAYATEQLLTLLHSLASRRSLKHKIAGHKKQYSLEIVADKKLGIRYILGVSDADASVIHKSLLSYLPGLKIKEIKDYLPADLCEKESNQSEHLKVIELKQKSDFVLPLKKHKTLGEHDPIAYLTGNMTKLGTGELMVFQVVATPITRSGHGSIIRHMGMIKGRIYHKLPLADKLFESPAQKAIAIPWAIFVALIKAINAVIKFLLSMVIAVWDTDGTSTPFLERPQVVVVGDTNNPYEQQLQEEVKEKIDLPMFETSLRLLVKSSDSGQKETRINGFLASFASLGSTYQSLIMKSQNIFSRLIPALQPLVPLVAREVSLSSGPILSVSELSDIYHFPYTQTTKTEDMVNSHSQDLPAPLSIKNNPDLDVVFGVNSYGNATSEIGLTDDDRSRHVYLIGQTGSGKSTIIHHMAADDIKKGRGLAVIDPHGDLAEGLLDAVPDKRLDDVVYLNPYDVDYPIGINLLELTEGLTGSQLELEKELVCESVISIFRRVFKKDDDDDAHRIEYILRNTIYTAFTVPEATIFTVYELLTDPDFKKSVISGLTDQNLINFWKNEFGKAGDYQMVKMVSGVTSKVGRFLFSPITKRILEQPRSTIDFDDVVNSGKILICNLAEGKLGEDTAQLLGTTVIAKVHLAMTRRARMNVKDRKPFYLFVDEFQNFATSSFTKLLSGGRKYGLRITIAEQSTAQQDDRNIVNVILANVGTVICFRTASPVDEDLMLSQFAPTVVRGDIANLPRHHFYIKLAALEPEDTFSGETLPVTLKENTIKRERLIESSRENYATAYVEPVAKPKPKKEVQKPKKARSKKQTKKAEKPEVKEINTFT